MATLNVSDLSVGDWVRYDGKEYQVQCVDGLSEIVTLFGYCEQREESAGNLRSIPITAEILKKNGWKVIEKEALGDEYKYDGEKRVWDDYNIDICETRQGVFWYSWGTEYYMWKLEYVHQLQHLIRLAGVDKEINL